MQTIKKNWVYALFAFALVFFVTSFYKSNAQRNNGIKVSVKTFHSAIGWGYDVYTNDSVYIHQEFIPALEGRKGFTTEKEALMIGRLVLAKMKHSKFPVVSLGELDSLGMVK